MLRGIQHLDVAIITITNDQHITIIVRLFLYFHSFGKISLKLVLKIVSSTFKAIYKMFIFVVSLKNGSGGRIILLHLIWFCVENALFLWTFKAFTDRKSKPRTVKKSCTFWEWFVVFTIKRPKCDFAASASFFELLCMSSI